MNKYEKFINWILKQVVEPLPKEFQEVIEELQDLAEQPEKPALTENGAKILEYLQQQEEKKLKAKDISAGMGISSRQVTGAMRKLVTDGFVSRHGQNPATYMITDKGKEFNIKEMNNEGEKE